jgi:hypothetical protein
MIDGLFVPIRPAIRSVMPVLMRLPGLTVGGFAADAADGLSVLIRLPISEVLPELIRVPRLVGGDSCVRGADGFIVPIRLPISEVLPELIRPVLVDGSLPAPELAPAGLLLPRELLNDLLVPEAVGGRAVLRRLGVAVRG